MIYPKFLQVKADNQKGLKILGGMNLVIHCHHYNSRLQRTIEENEKINGKQIIRDSAAKVYFRLLESLYKSDNKVDKEELAASLYSFLGFGTLDFTSINEGQVVSNSSHFVEGWNCGSIKTNGKVCRMTEGYLKAVMKFLHDKTYKVEECKCINEDHDECVFRISEAPEELNFNYDRKNVDFSNRDYSEEVITKVDKNIIVEAVSNMPLMGNNEGLIPAFNVYLAHTPQDFYNMISISFVTEMNKVNLKNLAEDMLVEDAEYCALNTFGGILNSEEWKALISPMVSTREDQLFGLIAVANALGWGKINITSLIPFESLTLESINGYESHGFLELVGEDELEKCFMLRGISSGIMALVYEEGELEDRHGKYLATENNCIVQGCKNCKITVGT